MADKILGEYEILETFNFLNDHFFRLALAGEFRRNRKAEKKVELLSLFSISIKPLLDKGFVLTSYPLKKGSGFRMMYKNMPWDFYYCEPEYYGAMMLFLTGNFNFNLAMRRRAKEKNYKLSQFGLFEGRERIAGSTEESIFYMLDLEYVSPGMRNFKSKDKLKERK